MYWGGEYLLQMAVLIFWTVNIVSVKISQIPSNDELTHKVVVRV